MNSEQAAVIKIHCTIVWTQKLVKVINI